MLEGSCHCGAVRLQVPAPPSELCLCNCSICRRYGALWAFYVGDDVRIEGREHLAGYVWGERTIDTMHCRHCGCVTHWQSLDGGRERMAVNARMLDAVDWSRIRVRQFDGAGSRRYLDQAEDA